MKSIQRSARSLTDLRAAAIVAAASIIVAGLSGCSNHAQPVNTYNQSMGVSRNPPPDVVAALQQRAAAMKQGQQAGPPKAANSTTTQ
jgi:ABC-type uncharacterized transport system auxiliary subunit